MTRILTVDDSRAIRSIVAKHVQEMGFDLDEAVDGEEGLLRLEDVEYDLVVLDVTMPNLDGPGMLKRMREAGNKTPVLMLTSESKRSIIADVMKLGIEDYILKPFKPDELKAKIQKILGAHGISPANPATAPVASAAADEPRAAPARAAAPAAEGAAPTQGRQFVDVLVIDDMENVAKKLRSFLPQHLSMQSCVSANAALAMCREKVYRVVLIDTEMPDVNSVTLMNQLRLLQPHAALLGLCLRSSPESEKQALGDGFDDVLMKPFQPANIEDFLLRYFDNQEILFVEDSLLRIGPFTGREDRLDRYFRRLQGLLATEIEKLAAACYDDVIVDLSKLPLKAEHVARLVLEIEKETKRTGLSLRLVGTSEGQALLKQFSDTGGISYFLSLADARQAA
jgi:DNA-binding response OmpR family regulator